MLSIDTNILLYAQNADCTEHRRAYEFVTTCADREDVAICELVLVELYLLLRNPAVVSRPLASHAAVRVCRSYRLNPRWRVSENAPVMEEVWRCAAEGNFARRRIVDARLALTLRHHEVTEMATANVKDFAGFGFDRVWDPLA